MLDEKRPYNMVWGVGGAQKYIQDGIEYLPDKKTVLVHEEPAIVQEEPASVHEEPASVQEEPASVHEEPDEHGKPHWRTLKAQVEAKGGVWTDSEAAIKFLGES